MLCCVFFQKITFAQCISTFPYHEDFETSNGNWTSGGTANDWAWGTPTKPVINSAGQGMKCWIVGGLTLSSYSNGERSYVKSPCFNFSNLHNPYIHFKIFWESEYKFDGCNLQYSLNNGTTWINVGAYNDPTDCYTANWFNYSNINYLTTLATTKHGWCGNIQTTSGSCQGGNGSNGWVIAKHCLNNLAGQSNVIFRFTFGAGTSCNAFDGVAFDDIYIEEAPKVKAGFSFACASPKNFLFTDTSQNCPSNWSWNFGDAASASNTSTSQNPSHTFSAAGIYTVTLIASNNCSQADTFTQQISVLGVTIQTTADSCFGGNNAKAIAVVTGANSTLNYSWNTTPVQNKDTAVNLLAGNYSVTVSENNTCSISTNFTINQPTKLAHNYVINNSSCSSSNGSAMITESGGTPNYTYVWQPSGNTTNSISNVSAGNYVVTIKDNNLCVDTAHITIANNGGNVTVSLNSLKSVSCFGGSNGKIVVNVSGGTPNYNYSWTPNVSSNNQIQNVVAGNYSLTVTDANGCSSSPSNFTITQPTLLKHLVNTTASTCHNSNGSAVVSESGGSPGYTYAWQPGGNTSNTLTGIFSGNYVITVKDTNQCVDTVHLSINNVGANLKVDTLLLQQISCYGANNGKINIGASGGKPTYTFVWQPSSVSGNQIQNLNVGNYSVTVTDANNCSASANFSITQPQKISITDTVNHTTCGLNNGSIKLNVKGGTPNYTYVWQPSVAISNNVSGIGAGNFIVTITDSKSCSMNDTIAIKSSTALQFVLVAQPDTCGAMKGIVSANILSGNAPYQYLWNNGSTASSVNHQLKNKIVTLTITDANACISSRNITVGEVGDFQIDIGNDTTICEGETIELSVSKNFKKYLWQDNSTNNFFSAHQKGVYFVKVENHYGCIATDTVVVENHCNDVLQMPNAFTPNGDGIDDFFGGITNHPDDLRFYRLKIYNRWGQEIFVSNNYYLTWDGKFNDELQPMGVFIYAVEYSFDGVNKASLKGNLTLLY